MSEEANVAKSSIGVLQRQEVPSRRMNMEHPSQRDIKRAMAREKLPGYGTLFETCHIKSRRGAIDPCKS